MYENGEVNGQDHEIQMLTNYLKPATDVKFNFYGGLRRAA
jgi:hypothetical protein